MKNYQSIRVNNIPLLIAGCGLLSFAMTSYYYNSPLTNPLLDFFCKMLSAPAYFAVSSLSYLGFSQAAAIPVIIFGVMFVIYSIVTLLIYAFFSNHYRRSVSE